MKLTERHKQIIDCLVQGYTNPQISKKLGLSGSYIQHMLNNMYQMTDTHNKHHLVAWAYQNKILEG